MRRLERIVRQNKVAEDSKGRKRKVNACRLCGYVWKSRGKGDGPKNCPRCRTTLWDDENVSKVACERCGHSWATTKGRPPKCPSCGSKRWDEEVLTVVCNSCGRSWRSHLRKGDPVYCPQCGALGPGEYRTESIRKTARKAEHVDGVPLDERALRAMWGMEDDIRKAVFLRNIGLTPEQADVIVSFDRGVLIPDIASRMSVPVSEVMGVVLPYMRICESMGARSWS